MRKIFVFSYSIESVDDKQSLISAFIDDKQPLISPLIDDFSSISIDNGDIQNLSGIKNQ